MWGRRFDIYKRPVLTNQTVKKQSSLSWARSSRKLITSIWFVVAIVLIAFNNLGNFTSDFLKNDGWRAEVAKVQASAKTFVIFDSSEPKVYAQAYLLLDEPSGEVILCHNCHQTVPVASTTKMITALVALEQFGPEEVITVPAKAQAVIGSKIGLQPGEKITLNNLLHGLLIQSGNDAALTIESAFDGKESEGEFVKKMNEYLTRHQLKDSHFADSAGLDDENGRSSAFELAQIARLLLANEKLASIVKKSEITISDTTGTISHRLITSNRLIQENSAYYMPDVLGVKTGFTPAAGHCLVSALKWQDRKLISVVLNTVETDTAASARENKKILTWAKSSLRVGSY